MSPYPNMITQNGGFDVRQGMGRGLSTTNPYKTTMGRIIYLWD
jgi:hypothetical protein